MRTNINTYTAMLVVTLFSSAMTIMIVNVGTTTVINDVMAESVSNHIALQQSVVQYMKR